MYLLDTTILSETMATRPSSDVLRWLDTQPDGVLFTTVVVVAELKKGQARVRDLDRSARLGAWIHEQIIPDFEGRILPVTLAVALRWGEMAGESMRRGGVLPFADSLIAATAIVHDLTVVTRNVADFERCGARVLSPWTGRA
jgi:predicted nucleic acid-binding protein